jgi:hypothetical protein
VASIQPDISGSQHEKLSLNQMSGTIQVTMQQDALLNFWGFAISKNIKKLLFNYNCYLLIFFACVDFTSFCKENAKRAILNTVKSRIRDVVQNKTWFNYQISNQISLIHVSDYLNPCLRFP